jgi:NADH:ubiquinone oxidoreductase subunit 6 (subunit J)
MQTIAGNLVLLYLIVLIITGVLAIIVAIVVMIVLLVLFLRKSKATIVSHMLWAVKYQIIVCFLFLVNIPTPILRSNTTGITVADSQTGIPGNDSYHLQAPSRIVSINYRWLC